MYSSLCFKYCNAVAAAAKSLQSSPTLCDPIDGSPPGSPVPGILQARILEWVAISFSNAWKRKVKVRSLSHVRLLATPWTAALQAPPSMGFSRQEYWSRVPLPSLQILQLSCLIWQLFYIPLHFWQLLNSSLSHVIIFYHFICEDFKFSIRSIILFLHSFDLLISHSSYCLIILPLFLSCIYIFFLLSTL